MTASSELLTFAQVLNVSTYLRVVGLVLFGRRRDGRRGCGDWRNGRGYLRSHRRHGFGDGRPAGDLRRRYRTGGSRFRGWATLTSLNVTVSAPIASTAEAPAVAD